MTNITLHGAAGYKAPSSLRDCDSPEIVTSDAGEFCIRNSGHDKYIMKNENISCKISISWYHIIKHLTASR